MINDIIKKLEPTIESKQAIIFDMDGTLIDSMPMWSHLDVEYMESIGITPKPDFHERVCSLTISLAAEYIHDEYNTIQSAQEIEDSFLNMADVYYREKIPLKPGIYELVKHYKAKGYKLAVATANDITMTEVCLKRLGIYEDMDAVVNCDMAKATKAKPDVYDLACKMLGSNRDNTVIFEDSLHAIKTAVGASYTVIGVFEETQKDSWDEICSLTNCQVVLE